MVLKEYFETVREAVGFKRFLLASLITGALAFAQLLSEYFHWIKKIPNYALAGAVASLALIWWLLSYATKLRKEKLPKLAATAITIRDNDDEYFVRVQLSNVTLSDGSGITSYLEEIVCEDVLGQIKGIDFPIPLYSQQRLAERIGGSDKNAPRPIDLRSGQPKWIEVFQKTHAFEPCLHIFTPKGRIDLIPHPTMKFRCQVYGFGPPVPFLVEYVEDGDNSWNVRLIFEEKCISESMFPLKKTD